MTLAEAEALLDDVREAARSGDNERAHVAEDELHEKVLMAIAMRRDDGRAADLADIAIRAGLIRFERWYA